MLPLLGTLGLALLLSSCTLPQVARLPPVDARFAARVYVVAPHEQGAERSARWLIVDGEAAATLTNGQYTALVLQPGPHLLSMGCQIGWGLAWSEDRLPVILDPRLDYFFELAPGGSCARHLTGLDPSIGRALMAQSAYVPVEQERGASSLPPVVSVLHAQGANIT